MVDGRGKAGEMEGVVLRKVGGRLEKDKRNGYEARENSRQPRENVSVLKCLCLKNSNCKN